MQSAVRFALAKPEKANMTDKIGTLRMQPSGKWAVCRPGRAPFEINAGEQFRIETPSGKGLKRTRMEFRHLTCAACCRPMSSAPWARRRTPQASGLHQIRCAWRCDRRGGVTSAVL